MEFSDQELIAAANEGDRAALETLYLRYRDWVVALAYRLTGNREDALDILQLTFLYLFKFPGFELRCQMKTFLYPVVRNLAIDCGRKRSRLKPLPPDQSDPPAPPERNRSAERQAVVEMVEKLPDEVQEVVILRFADDLSLAEIADALRIPVGTVKSRLNRALKLLREQKRRLTADERE